jgi:hypothetical protein
MISFNIKNLEYLDKNIVKNILQPRPTKDGLISERLSLWLQFPKQGAKSLS